MSQNGEKVSQGSFLSDLPIVSLKQDRLGHGEFAARLAQQLREHADPSPLIVGIYGPWGTGKSTLLNLIDEALKDKSQKLSNPIIIRFNPWNFSTIDQLITMFFSELGIAIGDTMQAKAKKELIKLTKSLATILRIGSISPVAGSSFGVASEILKTAAQHLDKGITLEKLKSDINSILVKSQRRIVVLIDDIDRLEPENMLLMFKLVRLIADFSNTTYLLASDRHYVEQVLSDKYRIDGRRYLEKIVQVGFDIPPPEPAKLAELFFEKLDKEVFIIPQEQWDREHWQELYLSGLRHFFRTPRDIIRYVNGIRINLPPLLGEINAVDFAGLEAIRTFSPQLYEFIRENRELFAPPPGSGGRSYTLDTANPVRDQLEAEFAKAGIVLAHACKETCQQLFPQLARFYQNMEYSSDYYLKWRREKRICSPNFFDRYFLLRVLSGDISEARLQLILSQSGDKHAIRGQLDQLLQEGKIERFTERLDDLAPSLINDNTSTLLTALFDIGDNLPSEAPKMLDVSPRLRVTFTAYRLLKNQKDSVARLETAIKIAKSTAGLATLVQFIATIQPEKEPSSVPTASREDLFSEEQFRQLRDIALNRIREEAKTSALSKRPDLAMILFRWKDWDSDIEPRKCVAELADSEEGLLDLLVGFVTIVRSTTEGKYTVLNIPNIRRDAIATFIDPDSIVNRVESIKSNRWSQLSQKQKIAVDAFLNPQRIWP